MRLCITNNKEINIDSCSKHKSRQSIGFCQKCGLQYCRKCLRIRSNDCNYCYNCLNKVLHSNVKAQLPTNLSSFQFFFFSSRLTALIIDSSTLFLLFVLFYYIFNFIFVFIILCFYDFFDIPLPNTVSNHIFFILFFIFSIREYVFNKGKYRQSIGKKIVGIHTINNDTGKKANFLQHLIRNCFFFVFIFNHAEIYFILMAIVELYAIYNSPRRFFELLSSTKIQYTNNGLI